MLLAHVANRRLTCGVIVMPLFDLSVFNDQSYASYCPATVARACSAWLDAKAEKFETEKTRRLQEIIGRRRWFSARAFSKEEALAILRREDPFFELTLTNDRCEHIRRLKSLAETTTSDVLFLCAKDAHYLAKFLRPHPHPGATPCQE